MLVMRLLYVQDRKVSHIMSHRFRSDSIASPSQNRLTLGINYLRLKPDIMAQWRVSDKAC
jgi:hypothetical protein